MPDECKVSIITVNYNGLDDTCALIDTIPFNDSSLEVIVVDNGSKVDEAAIIASKYPHVHVVRSNDNLGFAGGNNLGIAQSRGQYLFFVNNDTEFRPFNIAPLINRLESNGNIGIVCPKIRFAWGTNPIQFAGFTRLSPITIRNTTIGLGEEDRGQHDVARPTPYAHGAAMMVRRKAIEQVGMMPECYFLYYEELDWSMMMTRGGYEIWYEPQSCIFHKESRATGQNSPLKTYYITRNRLLFVKRNLKAPVKYLSYLYIICIVGSRDLIKHLIAGQFTHAKATLKSISDFIFKL